MSYTITEPNRIYLFENKYFSYTQRGNTVIGITQITAYPPEVEDYFRYGYELPFSDATIRVDSIGNKRYRVTLEVSTTTPAQLLDYTRGRALGCVIELKGGQILFFSELNIPDTFDYEITQGYPVSAITMHAYNTQYDLIYTTPSQLPNMWLLKECYDYNTFIISQIDFITEDNTTETLTADGVMQNMGDGPYTPYKQWRREMRTAPTHTVESSIVNFSDASYSTLSLSIGRYKQVIRFTTNTLPDYVKELALYQRIFTARIVDSTKDYAYILRGARVSFTSSNGVYTVELFAVTDSTTFAKTTL